MEALGEKKITILASLSEIPLLSQESLTVVLLHRKVNTRTLQLFQPSLLPV